MTIETLSYDRLEPPWRDWARIAWKFALALDNPWDREDLAHDIIVELAKVDKKYRQMGKPLTRWGALTVARYRRLRFYHDQARWRKVYSQSQGSLTQFIKHIIGLYKFPDAKARIQESFKAYMLEKNYLNANQVNFLRTLETVFADKHHIEIQLHNKALGDVGIGSDTPVTKNLKGITLRSALRLMLCTPDQVKPSRPTPMP